AGAALPGPVGALDWIVELPSTASGSRLNVGAEALFALAARPHSRLFVEPFVELDRTMDIAEGLLDRLCNPTPLFHLLRHLNTLLFSQPAPLSAIAARSIPGGRLLSGQPGATTLRLVLPDRPLTDTEIETSREGSVYELVSGHRIEKGLPAFPKTGNPSALNGPFLFV
nr:hypothetical protein [Caldilineaceae bacterium]